MYTSKIIGQSPQSSSCHNDLERILINFFLSIRTAAR